jgi:prepilin-type N-terminal cleavage/methylation domain-containing protein
MRQRAAHGSCIGSRAATSRYGLSPSSRSTGRRTGFTLIELVVAMAILLVVMIGVLSSVAFAYTSSNDTEMRNTAKNVASYTLEYLRARTVTRGASGLMTTLGMTPASTGNYGWYDASTNASGFFPSMIDVGDLPLQSDGYPCNYTSTYVRTTGPIVDGNSNSAGTGGIGAGGAVIRFASKHAAKTADPAALPPTAADTYADQPLAFTSTLQGYVSVMNTTPASAQNPADEDKNLARMLFSSTNVYRTLLTSAWTGLIVRYPGVYPSTQPVITSFTPLTGYLAKVYTTDASGTGKVKTTAPNPEYNPYYTNVAADKAATQAYRGFRVLTQVVARSAGSLDSNNFRHVQYYDVTVTVLWMNGTHESNYELVSRIVAY